MTRPASTRQDLLIRILPELQGESLLILGIRGFFAPENANKRGVYDDAHFIVLQDEVHGFNANVDPSVNRPGIAVLQPGTYEYKKGLHGLHHLNELSPDRSQEVLKQLQSTGKDVPAKTGEILPYWALRQSSNVTVLRDGKTLPQTDSPTDRFWIDIHRGGYTTTSSEGCQTIHPDQWPEYRDLVFRKMGELGISIVKYLLVLQ